MKATLIKLHPYIDYTVAVLLLLPWFTNYTTYHYFTQLMAACGVWLALYSLLSNYRGGVLRLIPYTLHLLLDVATSIFLALLPFLVPSSPYLYYWPFSIAFILFCTALGSMGKPFRQDPGDTNIIKPL